MWLQLNSCAVAVAVVLAATAAGGCGLTCNTNAYMSTYG